MQFSTETKITILISVLTVVVIGGGIFLFNKSNSNSGPQDYSQYIEKNVTLDQTKLNRDYSPKVTGDKKDDAKTASSTATSTPIAITEFLDYECPACAASEVPLVEGLLKTYGDRLTITKKIFPIHGQGSLDVGVLVLASQIFGGNIYQQLHTQVFATQQQWEILGKDDRDAFLKKLIVGLGIDYDKLVAESKNQKYLDEIAQDKQDALDLGIQATPSFIINGKIRVTGGLPLQTMIDTVDNN
jgi:protein-disulfide isomerase